MIVIVIPSVIVTICVMLSTTGYVNAEPQWKSYTSVDCGLELEYPVYKGSFLTPEVKTDAKNTFSILSLSSSLDDESISTEIKVDCSKPAAPLTEEIMEPLFLDALDRPAENFLINDFDFQTHQRTSLDFLRIDGEQAANFIVGGLHGISVADVDWVNQVIVTNHGSKQYKIDLYYTGNRIVPDFGETFTLLDNHIIESIKFTN